jgi:purine nucleosidase
MSLTLAAGASRVLAGLLLVTFIALAPCAPAFAQKRMVIIDQDTSGPGGSNIMSLLVLLQSPQVDVLGITVVTGNAWRDDEARHALRMLELIGRADVPVALGAVFPLVRTQEETRLMQPLVGKVAWLGAWGQQLSTLAATPGLIEPPTPAAPLGPWDTPPLTEGEPHTKPITEDAVHFMIRQVRAHPHQITIYAAGYCSRRRARPAFRRIDPRPGRHGRQPRSAHR